MLVARANKLSDKSFTEIVKSHSSNVDNVLRSMLLGTNDVSIYALKKLEHMIEAKAVRNLNIDIIRKLEYQTEGTFFLSGIHGQNTAPVIKRFLDSKRAGLCLEVNIMK